MYECLECGLNGEHTAYCGTARARYWVSVNNQIDDYEDVESELYKTLVQIRENKGTLSGVKVYDYGKKLTRAQLGELALRQLNGD